MDQLDQVDQRLCNTKLEAYSECDGKKHRAYIITWNNYTVEEFEWLKEYCKKECDQHVLQEEKGANGTPHIQGALYYKSMRSFSAIKKSLPKCHIEWARSWAAIKEYCQKKDTRNGETIIDTKDKKPRFPFKIKDVLEGKELRPFQKEVMAIIESEPDDRTIYWFWEAEGNVGKTALARHICIKDPNALYLTGKAGDMKYAVFTAVNEGIDVRTIILDLTRTVESFTGSMYQGIEEMKNGIFFNTKYESKMCIFNHPHIICFANWLPNFDKLSADRWKVVNIDNRTEEEKEIHDKLMGNC